MVAALAAIKAGALSAPRIVTAGSALECSSPSAPSSPSSPRDISDAADATHLPVLPAKGIKRCRSADEASGLAVCSSTATPPSGPVADAKPPPVLLLGGQPLVFSVGQGPRSHLITTQLSSAVPPVASDSGVSTVGAGVGVGVGASAGAGAGTAAATGGATAGSAAQPAWRSAFVNAVRLSTAVDSKRRKLDDKDAVFDESANRVTALPSLSFDADADMAPARRCGDDMRGVSAVVDDAAGEHGVPRTSNPYRASFLETVR